MKSQGRGYRLQVTAIALLLIASCLLPVLGCKESDIRKAAKAADDVAVGLGGLEQVNEQVYASNLINAGETTMISTQILAATVANDQFIAKVRELKKIDSGNKGQIVQWFGSVAASLDLLNQQAVLGIKNPDAKAKLSIAFASVKAAADVIAQVLQYNGTQHSALSTQPDEMLRVIALDRPIFQTLELKTDASPKPELVFAGIGAAVLNPATLGLLISLAIQLFGAGSKVVQTIHAESGLTDDELLAVAEKHDQATREAVVAHLKEIHLMDGVEPVDRPPAQS